MKNTAVTCGRSTLLTRSTAASRHTGPDAADWPGSRYSHADQVRTTFASGDGRPVRPARVRRRGAVTTVPVKAVHEPLLAHACRTVSAIGLEFEAEQEQEVVEQAR